MIYTIDFFHQLMQDESLTFSLSNDVLEVLEHLDKEVEIPEFTGGGGVHGGNTGHAFQGALSKHDKSELGGAFKQGQDGNHHKMKKMGGSKRGGGAGGAGGGFGKKKDAGQHAVCDEDWELARSFKATVIEKKTGVDKIMENVRINMNKMSNTTYEKQKEIIASLISEYFASEECNDENTGKLSSMVLQISSGNKFYSALYVDLYGYLIGINPVFKDSLNVFIEEFDKTIENIVYVDPNINYDAYCDYVKANEGRQATTMFLANLMKTKIVDELTVLQIIRSFMDIILKYVDEQNRVKEVEEITENVAILYTNTKENATGAYKEKWDDIVNDMQKLAQSYSKEYLSLSNRAIFKYMDMMEM